AAWQDLLADDRADGVLSPASSRFAARAEDSIAELAEQLRAGTYRPSPLTEVVLPGEAGHGHRVLQVPSVGDGILEEALVAALPRGRVLLPRRRLRLPLSSGAGGAPGHRAGCQDRLCRRARQPGPHRRGPAQGRLTGGCRDSQRAQWPR